MEAIVMETFRNRLKMLTEEKREEDINQNRIAAILDIKSQAYSRLINGEGNPNLKTIEKLADYFKVSIDYLLGKSNVKQPEKTEVQNEGLAALKAHFDLCATMNTNLIDTLNCLMGVTIIKLSFCNNDLDTLVLNIVSDTIQQINDFINLELSSDINNNREETIYKFFKTADSINNLFTDNCKTIINGLYSNNLKIKNEGETNGDSTQT
jgi:transcriptional regulator with XRE-family HTH domain